jgi:hypothetical protein
MDEPWWLGKDLGLPPWPWPAQPQVTVQGSYLGTCGAAEVSLQITYPPWWPK